MGEGLGIPPFLIMFRGCKFKGVRRILVVRTDRIGDVILSTPVLEGLREQFPKAYIAMLVQPSVVELVAGNPCLDEVIIDDRDGQHRGIGGFLQLVESVRDKGFEVALVLHSTFRVALLSLLAGIPCRIGPASRIYALFLYNRPLFQHRSRVEKHEADYNLDLAEALGVERKNRRTFIPLSEGDRRSAREFLRVRRKNGGSPLVIVHPGMGGSAKNWRADNYARLIEVLAYGLGMEIFLIGSEGDRWLVERVISKVNKGRVTPVVGGLGLRQLAALIAEVDLFIGPSTGPMHIAGAVGTPVVALFSPVRVQSACRWGPYHALATVLTPQVECQAHHGCIGEKCEYYDCMDLITPQQVAEEANRLLNSGAG